MIPDNVTLIVKAPNQQIEDQNIECQSSWSVKQLKGYLSEVYPSKPKTEEQKIIYSGRLLDDNLILKDVLRSYESQHLTMHIMHLVCSSRHRMAEEKQKEHLNKNLRSSDTSRENPDQPTESTRPETRQNDQNHTMEMHNYISSFVNNYGNIPPYPTNNNANHLPVEHDPALLANHVMMMQQAYIRYMQQYAHMLQTGGTFVPNGIPQAPATPALQAGEGVRGVAEGGVARVEQQPNELEEGGEDMARDWLDHVYTASRFAILFSLIYLYGSPARLLLVLFLAAAGYLHQIGFFRELHLNPQNDANEAQRNRDGPGAPERDARGEHQPEAERGGSAAERPTTTDNNNYEQQSLLAVTWMIFTSFFSSLVPEAN